MPPSSDFDTLLTAARSGDAASAAALWGRHVRTLHGAIRKRLSPALRRRYESGDIAQSVFGDVLRGLPAFENRGEAAFRHWLLLKVENKVRDKARALLHGRAEPPERPAPSAFDPPANGRSPASGFAAHGEDERLLGALLALDGESRLIVRLRTEDGLSFAEIARVVALPSDEAARKRYARALVTLRGLLTEPHAGDRPSD